MTDNDKADAEDVAEMAQGSSADNDEADTKDIVEMAISQRPLML